MKLKIVILSIFFSSLGIIGCKSSKLNDTDPILNMERYIYPLDTVELEGFVYSELVDSFLIVFSKKGINLDSSNFIKLLKNRQAAIYFSPYTFNSSIPKYNYNITPERAIEIEDLVFKKNDSSLTREAVDGAFIVGITKTSKVNDLISHSYNFKDDFVVLIVSPLPPKEK